MSEIQINKLGDKYFCKINKDIDIKPQANIQATKYSKDDIQNILLCDTSGSMDSYWKEIATFWNDFVKQLDEKVKIILFDDEIKHINESTLPYDIYKGSSTNIILGINELIKEIYAVKNKKYIRVFFITDGVDNVNYDFENKFTKCMNEYIKPKNTLIEVFILALSKNAPSLISQKMRNAIHTGRNSIQQQYWYEYNYNNSNEIQQREIKNEFELMYNDVQHFKMELPFECSVNLIEKQTTVYHNNIILFNESDISKLETVYDIKVNNFTNVYEMFDMFRQWITDLQNKVINITNYDEKTIIDNANKIKNEMQTLFNLFITEYNNNINNNKIGAIKKLYDRIANKKINSFRLEYNQLLKIVSDIASGNKTEYNNNLGLSKSIKSVHVGKYDEKAYKLRGYTDKDFEKYINEFINIINEEKEELKKLTNTDRCMITLDNLIETITGDIFIEETNENKKYIELLKENEKNDIITTFPLLGNACDITISNGLVLNAWIAVINYMSDNTAIISSSNFENYFCETNDVDDASINQELYKYPLKINNTIEKINCVIPLYDKKIAESKAFGRVIRSSLVQAVLTFAILKSINTINYDTHLGSMAGLLGYLLKSINKTSDDNTDPIYGKKFIENTINKIIYTSKIYTDHRKVFKNYIETLWNNPSLAVITQNDNENIKCESITKALLMFLVSYKDKTKDQINNTMYQIWKEFIGRLVSQKDFNDTDHGMIGNIKKLFKINEDCINLVKFPEIDSIYNHEYTITETLINIENKLKDIKFNECDKINLEFNYDELVKFKQNTRTGNVSVNELLRFNKIVGYEIDIGTILQFVVHGLKYTDSNDRRNEDVSNLDESKKYIIKELSFNKFTNYKNTKISELKDQARKIYYTKVEEYHKNTFPLTKAEIIDYVNDNKILDIEINNDNFYDYYSINLENNLLSNACMSKDCKHFLVPHTNFSNHLNDIYNKPGFIHCFHKVINKLKNTSTANIIDNIKNGSYRPQTYVNEPININSDINTFIREINDNIQKYNEIGNTFDEYKNISEIKNKKNQEAKRLKQEEKEKNKVSFYY